ncbi:MAG: hypothetical protein ACM3WV_04540 [Bacillota bacterium]
MQDEVKGFREETTSRFDMLETRMDRIEGRMTHVENRMEKLEGRMDKIENRMDAVGKKLDRHIKVHKRNHAQIMNQLQLFDDEIHPEPKGIQQ